MRPPETKRKNKERHPLLALMLMATVILSVGRGRLLAAPEGGETPGVAKAPLTASLEKPAKKTLEEVLAVPFGYRRDSRSDPFMPFITEQTGPKQMAPEEDAPLAGMQLFEPGQLTLVAIMVAGQQTVAMAEDSTGMGHLLKVKDKIGRRGEVKAIVPNAVVIEEWSLTPSGVKRSTTTEMVLRKEGDKE